MFWTNPKIIKDASAGVRTFYFEHSKGEGMEALRLGSNRILFGYRDLCQGRMSTVCRGRGVVLYI